MRRPRTVSEHEDEIGMRVPPPSPEEIRERAAEVRATWSPARWRRAIGGSARWLVPLVRDPHIDRAE